MPEIPDRLPGEIIAASHPNLLRQRSAQRYTDATQRDASVPLPETGEPAYITGAGLLQVYDGTEWVDQINGEGGLMTTGSSLVMGEYDTTTNTPIAWHRLAGGVNYASEVVGGGGFFRAKTGIEGQTTKDVELRLNTTTGDALAPFAEFRLAAVEALWFNKDELRSAALAHTLSGSVLITDGGADLYRKFEISRDGREFLIEPSGAGPANWNVKGRTISTTGELRFFGNNFLNPSGIQVLAVNGTSGPYVSLQNVQNVDTLELPMLRNVLVSLTEPTSGDGEEGDIWMRVIAP